MATHLACLLLSHETGGRLDGEAGLVESQTLDVAVGGDTLGLRRTLYFFDLHFSSRVPTSEHSAWERKSISRTLSRKIGIKYKNARPEV